MFSALLKASTSARREIARPWAIACSGESLRDGFLDFHGQLSEPQINLKNYDEPEPKPPASSILKCFRVCFRVVTPHSPKSVTCVHRSALSNFEKGGFDPTLKFEPGGFSAHFGLVARRIASTYGRYASLGRV